MLRSVLVASAVVVAAIPQTPSQAASQQLPTFRTGVDIVELDVSVLDNHRRPVKGLTADDFTILEGGKPQPIVAFSSIDVPGPVPYSAAWMRDAPLDVVSNVETPRLVTIVMDDAYTGRSPNVMARAKDIARAAINQLGPRDLASVVFTFSGRGQNFTADRSQLMRAVDSYVPKVDTGGFPTVCDPKIRSCDIEALAKVASMLASAPPGRKLVILVSGGRAFDFGEVGDAGVPSSGVHRTEAADLVDAFAALQHGNVTVYSFDAHGLQSREIATRGFQPFEPPQPFSGVGSVSALSADESLQAFAESTGGRAVTNTNYPAADVATAFRESSTYYFVGFRSLTAGNPGDFRKIEVKLNRSGYNVRTRNGYYTPGMPSRLSSTSGLPAGDLPLRASAAVFAVPDRSTADVVVAAGIDPIGDRSVGSTIDLTATALDLDGEPCGSQHESIALGSGAQPEIPVHLALEPGRYLVQLSAQTGPRSATVVIDVEVPEFSREPLSASSLIVRRALAPAPVSFVPSTIRDFRSTDGLTASLRVYQGGNGSIMPVKMSARVINQKNDVTSHQSALLTATSFSQARSADYAISLPISQLSAGQYLLQVEAEAGSHRIQRTARFSVVK